MPDKRLDGPDEVSFIKEIAKHLPGTKEHNSTLTGLIVDAIGFNVSMNILRNARKNAPKRK